jgi:putative toxin-antitoxin system antitoxin component (TIGR02293 family)
MHSTVARSSNGNIPLLIKEYSMSLTTAESGRRPPAASGAAAFVTFRAVIDQRVLQVFANKLIRRSLRDQIKLNLAALWERIARTLAEQQPPIDAPVPDQWDVHQAIVKGLAGEALYVSCAMAFDSMQEGLPFFDMSAKTARLKLNNRLSVNQGETAMRIGRALVMASGVFESLEAARQYLRTPNFALGGELPRNLLRTAEGEQLVLSELQTQAAGGPV